MAPRQPEMPFRRKYPRRAYQRRVSILIGGRYAITEGDEIGEGGLAFVSAEMLSEGDTLVVNFRIPGGDFVSLRATVRSSRGGLGTRHYGIAFENISFSHKRQIRAYVSSRSATEQLIQ